MKKIFNSIIIGIASLLVLAGCTTNKEVQPGGQTLEVLSGTEKVMVPKDPKKVVVFDNSALDTLDALGLGDRVIGAPVKSLPEYLQKFKNVDSVGGIKEPDLEKINQLKPDLIIISGRQADFQKDLKAIAPVLYLTLDTQDTWKSIQANIELLGKVFDKEKEVASAVQKLQLEVETIRSKAEQSNQKALILLVNEGKISVYGKGSRYGMIHDALGFKLADESIVASTHGQDVSYEYILEKNPDVIFVIDRTKAIGGDTSNNAVASNALIQQTTAGKNGKIIDMNAQVWYLAGSGIESVQIMLADVQRGL